MTVSGKTLLARFLSPGVFHREDVKLCQRWAATAGTLTYPGRPEIVGGKTFIPIASIRLKQLRDGMEDNGYYHALEALLGRATAMAQLKKVVTNAFTYTRDVALWEKTRVETGSMIEAAMLGSQTHAVPY